ncbi:MAG: kinase/pyrophosphorylase [Granulosicoccus sp.]|nr:kinase/pyrophosphorylase [Granulosicoccus sp.]
MQERYAFVISDRTGLTAEAMAHSLLSQFPKIDFQTETLPFIDTIAKARDLVDKIADTVARTGSLPLLFVTLVDDEIREIIKSSDGVVFDLFDTFIGPMEKELSCESSHSVGQSHGVADVAEYTSRIAAVHFSLATDDGMETDHYRKADIILIGVSRCGKTPTSLYLAMHFGIFASNYPLTEQELLSKNLPEALQRYEDKVFGLTIDPFRLLEIRQERYAGETYSSVAACQKEVAQAESIFRSTRIPYINTTRSSIEEISATIMHRAGLRRKI